MFIGCWGCCSCRCSDGLACTMIPPAEDESVGAFPVTFFGIALVRIAWFPLTITIDGPEKFFP